MKLSLTATHFVTTIVTVRISIALIRARDAGSIGTFKVAAVANIRLSCRGSVYVGDQEMKSVHTCKAELQ